MNIVLELPSTLSRGSQQTIVEFVNKRLEEHLPRRRKAPDDILFLPVTSITTTEATEKEQVYLTATEPLVEALFDALKEAEPEIARFIGDEHWNRYTLVFRATRAEPHPYPVLGKA